MARTTSRAPDIVNVHIVTSPIGRRKTVEKVGFQNVS